MPRGRHVTTLVTELATSIAVLVLAMAGAAHAQDRPAPVAEFEVGWVGFADDGIVSEPLIGGAVRWYVLPRVSIGPEIVFLDGRHHDHMMITGNVTWDLVAPTGGRPAAVTPFVVLGGGVFQTRESFPRGTFTSHEGTFTAGGGVRASVGNRVTLGVDARVGWELHLRVTGLVGVRLGR